MNYQIETLTAIGKKCLSNPLKACQDFMHTKVNIRTALADMVDLKSPELLFATPQLDGVYTQRSIEDISYILLAFHEYHDSLDGQLLPTLKALMELSTTDTVCKPLIQTLLLLIWRQEKDWVALDDAVTTITSKDILEEIRANKPSLALLCSALIDYAQGKLYVSGPKYVEIEEKDKDFCSKRMKCLTDSLEKLDLLPRALNGPVKYFSIHVMMVYAEATWAEGLRKVHYIRVALSICRQAEKYTRYAPILLPLYVAVNLPISSVFTFLCVYFLYVTVVAEYCFTCERRRGGGVGFYPQVVNYSSYLQGWTRDRIISKNRRKLSL